jgi:hypothetical protein
MSVASTHRSPSVGRAERRFDGRSGFCVAARAECPAGAITGDPWNTRASRIPAVRPLIWENVSMAHAEAEDTRKLLDWEALEVGENLPSFSYVLTQQMIDEFRQGVMDPEAAFPTIAHKVDVNAYHMAYRDAGSVNARCTFHCYNPPIAGKRITVQAWIADKYLRRGKTYIVTQAVSVDEDGRLLDRVITHELKQVSEVGKKWQ